MQRERSCQKSSRNRRGERSEAIGKEKTAHAKTSVKAHTPARETGIGECLSILDVEAGAPHPAWLVKGSGGGRSARRGLGYQLGEVVRHPLGAGQLQQSGS